MTTNDQGSGVRVFVAPRSPSSSSARSSSSSAASPSGRLARRSTPTTGSTPPPRSSRTRRSRRRSRRSSSTPSSRPSTSRASWPGVLPPRLQPLAGPAAGGIRELAGRAAEKAVESPKVQQLWADANRAAHEQLIVVIEGGDGALSTEGGVVTLDLAQLVEQIGARVGIDVAGKLPESIGEVEVIKSDELAAAQDAADLLEKLAYGLILAALAVYAIAIWLARGRRRETVRAIGFGWIVVGAGDPRRARARGRHARRPAGDDRGRGAGGRAHVGDRNLAAGRERRGGNRLRGDRRDWAPRSPARRRRGHRDPPRARADLPRLASPPTPCSW